MSDMNETLPKTEPCMITCTHGIEIEYVDTGDNQRRIVSLQRLSNFEYMLRFTWFKEDGREPVITRVRLKSEAYKMVRDLMHKLEIDPDRYRVLR